jgi:PAS domain S-box-containing protein
MQLSIRARLGLGTGVVLGLFLTSGLAMFWEAGRITHLVEVLTELEKPAAAADEMEINLAETGLALKGYLHNPSPEVLDQLRDSEKDFRQFHTQYYEIAGSPRAKRLGERVEQSYNEYLALAKELIDLHDEQKRLLTAHFHQEQSLYNHLDAGFHVLLRGLTTSSSAKLKAVQEMDLSMRSVALSLTNLLRANTPEFEIHTYDYARGFFKRLDQFLTLTKLTPEERRWGMKLRDLFNETMEFVNHLVALETRKQDLINQTSRLRLSLEEFLDEEVQKHIQDRLWETKRRLLEVEKRGVPIVFVLLFIATMVSVPAVVLTTRSISQPLKRLLSAIEATRQGDLSRRIEVTSEPEVSRLALAFNQMAEDLQRTTVSRGYVEGIIHAMSESLIVVSSEGKVETINAATCALLGYREIEFIGIPFKRVFVEWSTVAERVCTANIQDFEATYHTKDGRQIPVLCTANRKRSVPEGADSIVFVALDITERKRAGQELAESRTRLRELTRHLNASIEEERARIALEIHDQLGQAMTCLKLDTLWLGRRLEGTPSEVEPSVHDRIETMTELINDTIQTLRRVATELRPAVVDDSALGPALDILAAQFRDRTGVAYEVSFPEHLVLT